MKSLKRHQVNLDEVMLVESLSDHTINGIATIVAASIVIGALTMCFLICVGTVTVYRWIF